MRRWRRSPPSPRRKAPITSGIRSEWIIRLGDGTEESHPRAQAAIDDLWAFTGEMFSVDDGERGLIDDGIAVDPAACAAMARDGIAIS